MSEQNQYFVSGESFLNRHIGPAESEINEMLNFIGESSLSDFIAKVVPQSIRNKINLSEKIPQGIAEDEALAELKELAKENKVFRSYIGMGYYRSKMPNVIARNILENPGWYTAYTPYQPEISQGRLEALYLFQTLVTQLTGLDIANASMLDEGTAGAEAITMALRAKSGAKENIFLDDQLHPQTIEVIKVRLASLGISYRVGPWQDVLSQVDDFGVVVLSQWGSNGVAIPSASIQEIGAAIAKSDGALVIATDLLGSMINPSAGSLGAAIAFGSTGRFGIPLGLGGPAAGFLACRSGLERSLPGRLVGKSVDVHQNPAFRLALQTREQHIRREKATSNICTAQVLLAVLASFYAIWHGKSGLTRIALEINQKAKFVAEQLRLNGFELLSDNFFDTITIKSKVSDKLQLGEIRNRALSNEINFRYYSQPDQIAEGLIGISFDETVSDSDIVDILNCFGVDLSAQKLAEQIAKIAVANNRSDEFLTQEIYHQKFSETRMLRYIRSLSDKDLALDRTMIPLGSCTMKLNATAEMLPISWPEFSQIHPFAPQDQWVGYQKMIAQVSHWLTEITGYEAVSLAPNAGSQGEFAGLLAIKQYLVAKGESDRNICLIPASAHGTNAASAAMAGMQVVVVACDEEGNVSLTDLKEKIATHGEKLAALMITYPSTHGVFEEEIREICALVHQAGGQVYVDGANLNALVGLASPGEFGADVSHLNLHKTFAIPHGGGGPGIGPVIAKAHLADFLPRIDTANIGNLIFTDTNLQIGAKSLGPITSAPFGSAGVLPITWMYIRMMGGAGLELASKVAILNANYISRSLAKDFPTLYTGKNKYVAHECILDLRNITKETGVSVDDVAKRLMDFGFHAPTMSFPVSGTLMVEPTESEDKGELDRFIGAMKIIAQEIAQVAQGVMPIAESPLRNAPHTQEDLLRLEWNRLYEREIGAFGAGLDDRNDFLANRELNRPAKYWPAVGRIDGVYGDRNLVCACLPMEAYA